MKQHAAVACIALTSVFCSGCLSRLDKPVLVARVPYAGIAPAHVQNLLTQGGVQIAGIESKHPGDCRVSVHMSDQQTALKLLLRDAVRRPYIYIWVDGCKTKLGPPPFTAWPQIRFNLDLAGMAKSKTFQSDANLRAVAENAIAETIYYGFPGTKGKALRPIATVRDMRLLAMEYVGDDLKVHRGYAAVVNVVFKGRPSIAPTQVDLEAWDDGRKVKIFLVEGASFMARNPPGTTAAAKKGDELW